MPDAPQIPDAQQLVDVDYVARLTGLSRATIWRYHASGYLPQACKIKRAVRWRLRTGDPQTGLLDWCEAGCPSLQS